MTTLVAYGQAVQNQFGIITDKDRLNIGTTIHNNSDLVVGKVPHISLYDGSKAITSPFIYTPKAIDTSELLLQIPAIKDDLIEAKKEAVRFFEKLESAEKDAKTKDQKIENQEKVIKSLRDQIDLIKKDINVIREAKFIGSLTEDFQVGQLSCKNSMVYYGRDYIHFPTQEKWVCLLLMQASKEKDSVVSENTLSESISTKNGLSHKNLQKLVSNVRRTLKRKNAKIQIKYLNGESFMMILNDIR